MRASKSRLAGGLVAATPGGRARALRASAGCSTAWSSGSQVTSSPEQGRQAEGRRAPGVAIEELERVAYQCMEMLSVGASPSTLSTTERYRRGRLVLDLRRVPADRRPKRRPLDCEGGRSGAVGGHGARPPEWQNPRFRGPRTRAGSARAWCPVPVMP